MILYAWTFAAGFVTGIGVGAYQWAVFSIHKHQAEPSEGREQL